MSIVDEFRSRHHQAQSRRAGLIALALSVVFVVVIGGGAVLAWQRMAPSAQEGTTIGAALFGWRSRIGHADKAPLLHVCSKSSKALVDSGDTRTIYLMSRTRHVPPEMLARAVMLQDDARSGSKPVPIIECILTRDKAALCDPDNRALAVEFIADFLDLARRAEPDLAKMPASKQALFEQASGIAARPRVLAALRDHLREGRLVADDFGASAAPEVMEAIAAVKPMYDACAQRFRSTAPSRS